MFLPGQQRWRQLPVAQTRQPVASSQPAQSSGPRMAPAAGEPAG